MNRKHKMVFILLVTQPVIDLLTSLTTLYFEWPVSFGVLVRPIIMAGILFYAIYYFLHQNRKLLLFIFGSFMSVLLMLVVSFLSKENISWFQELNFAFKTSYFIVMIALSILVLQKEIIAPRYLNKAIDIIALIIGVSFWVSFITNTSVKSYSYDGGGFSGWFFAANELSVIVIIVLGLIVAKLNKDQGSISWLALILILSVIPSIGTKTSFLGALVILFLYLIILLWKTRLQFWKDKTGILYTLVLALFIISIPLTPIGTNQQSSTFEPLMVKKEKNQADLEVHDGDLGPSFLRRILSSRDLYFVEIKEDYVEANTMRKFFGLGYAGDYKEAPKVIEMDFFDLFFSYGLVGSILLLLPFIYLILKGIVFPFTKQAFLIQTTLTLCLGISFLAGHVLFAPSVMSYVTIAFIMLGYEVRRTKT